MPAPARVDSNQRAIVEGLRKAGYSVWITSALGKGAPDLVVGKGGCNWLVELKDGSLPPSRRKLTIDETCWHLQWRGQVDVANTLEEALEICR